MELNNIDLLSLQTSYMQQDQFVKALCKALEPYIKLLDEYTILTYIYGRINELNEEVVDSLAWQFHVDFYDYTLPIEMRRELVKNSIRWHKIKGTPQAVIEVITELFGDTQLQEWFEYDGEPYFFKVDIDVIKEVLTKENLKRVFELIDAYKNRRSWLEILRLHLHAKSKANNFIGSTLVSATYYVLTSDFNIKYNSSSSEKLAAITLNTTKYTLTNDINTNYSTEGMNNMASNLVKASKYVLSNNIDEHNDLNANLNQASTQVETMKYELS